jgi:hypothetical protein
VCSSDLAPWIVKIAPDVARLTLPAQGTKAQLDALRGAVGSLANLDHVGGTVSAWLAEVRDVVLIKDAKPHWRWTMELIAAGDVTPPPPPGPPEIVTLWGSLGVGASTQWAGAVVAPNGNIYAVPFNAESVLNVVPSTNAVSTITTTGYFGYIGAVVAPNGKIYAVPSGGTNIFVFDPATETASSIGTYSFGGSKWHGAVIVGNVIYGIPFNATEILRIDTTTDTITTFGTLSGTAKWTDGVVVGTNIYGIPFNSDVILKIDTTTDTITTFGTLGSGGTKWYGGIARGGIVYGTPSAAENILRIDTSDDSISTIGTFSTTAGKLLSAALGADGNIYMPPANELDRVYRITASDVVEPVGMELTLTASAWWVAAVATANAVYGTPGRADQAVRINTT